MTQNLRTEARQIAGWLKQAESAYALTGAGVSTDSGIPDFRGQNGLWQDRDPMEVASSRALHEQPHNFFQFWTDRFAHLEDASPNITHYVLAELEQAGLLSGVITQNIDGLHKQAGSQQVFQVHGNFRISECEGCGQEVPTTEILDRFQSGDIPYCQKCGGLIRPAVVLFGEQLDEDLKTLEQQLYKADLLLVLGSSLGVHPVASFVPAFHQTGGNTVIINLDPTPYDELADIVHHGKLHPVMKSLRKLLELKDNNNQKEG